MFFVNLLWKSIFWLSMIERDLSVGIGLWQHSFCKLDYPVIQSTGSYTEDCGIKPIQLAHCSWSWWNHLDALKSRKPLLWSCWSFCVRRPWTWSDPAEWGSWENSFEWQIVQIHSHLDLHCRSGFDVCVMIFWFVKNYFETFLDSSSKATVEVFP